MHLHHRYVICTYNENISNMSPQVIWKKCGRCLSHIVTPGCGGQPSAKDPHASLACLTGGKGGACFWGWRMEPHMFHDVEWCLMALYRFSLSTGCRLKLPCASLQLLVVLLVQLPVASRIKIVSETHLQEMPSQFPPVVSVTQWHFGYVDIHLFCN
jgi:hypothetical protein